MRPQTPTQIHALIPYYGQTGDSQLATLRGLSQAACDNNDQLSSTV